MVPIVGTQTKTYEAKCCSYSLFCLSFLINFRTFSYIMRELPKVPTHVPVCVLGNHRDMGEHRVILPDDIRDLIASLNR